MKHDGQRLHPPRWFPGPCLAPDAGEVRFPTCWPVVGEPTLLPSVVRPLMNLISSELDSVALWDHHRNHPNSAECVLGQNRAG